MSPPLAFSALALALAITLLGCTDDAADPPSDPPPDDLPAAGCTAEALATPTASTTYYVAIGETGADNTACDGRAPTDEGGGHCPFRDLAALKAHGLLETRDVRIELRAGTYLVAGLDGLKLMGGGMSAAQPLVLSSYGTERVVLDVAIADPESCLAMPTPADCVREVVKIEGHHVVVQGITIQNGLGYDIEIAGDSHIVRCNQLGYTVGFSQRSDLMKLYARDVRIVNNEFSGWSSQAIDLAGATGGGIVIEHNEFHHPSDHGCGVTGVKLGARDIIVRDNDVHDIVSPHCTGKRTILGGGGTEERGDPIAYSAQDIVVTGNRITNVNAPAIGFASCRNCAFEGNTVYGALAGVWLQSYVTGMAGCGASETGCKPNEGIRITGNRLANLTSPQHVVHAVDAGEATGLTAADNVYCGSSAAPLQFLWEGALVPFADWATRAGTDASSVVIEASDPRCAPPTP